MINTPSLLHDHNEYLNEKVRLCHCHCLGFPQRSRYLRETDRKSRECACLECTLKVSELHLFLRSNRFCALHLIVFDCEKCVVLLWIVNSSTYICFNVNDSEGKKFGTTRLGMKRTVLSMICLRGPEGLRRCRRRVLVMRRRRRLPRFPLARNKTTIESEPSDGNDHGEHVHEDPDVPQPVLHVQCPEESSGRRTHVMRIGPRVLMRSPEPMKMPCMKPCNLSEDGS